MSSSVWPERPLGKVASSILNPVEIFRKSILMYYVYILKSLKTGKLYIGHSDNLDRRIEEHNTGRGGKYTRQNGPWKLVYSETHPDRSSAMKRERYLKGTKGSHEKKILAGVTKKILFGVVIRIQVNYCALL